MSEQDLAEVKRYLEGERRTREFWATVRAALIMFIKAIEKRYEIERYNFSETRQVPIAETDSVTGLTKG